MPQITIEYSAPLQPVFRHRELTRALHDACVELVEADLSACKTLYHRIEETFIGDGDAAQAMVRVQIALLTGRAEEARTALADRGLDLLRRYVGPVEGWTLHLSVEIREMDRPTYRKSVSG